MPLNLASPGIVVREVDLTVGRVDTASDKVGALVGPFAKGSVDLPILVENEQDLLDNFGQPYSADKHYEYWLTASSYLSYGGPLRIVRADDDDLKNAFAGSASDIKIKSTEHYNDLGYDGSTITGVTVVARNPGSWGNGLKVAIIDDLADQVLTFSSLPSNIAVGFGITQSVPANTVVAGSGTTSLLTGFFKGIVTEVDSTNKKVSVKILESVDSAGVSTEVSYQPNGIYKFGNTGLTVRNNSGISTGTGTPTANVDWFDSQTIQLTNSTINWNNIADRPGTSSFAEARNSRFDEVHVVVIDDLGEVTGNAGTILEKHLSLSKAKDGEYSLGSPSYWRKYTYNNSSNIFAGGAPAGIVTTSFGTGGSNFTLSSDVGWDQNAQGIRFGATGVNTLTLGGGKNYDGGTDEEATGAFQVTLSGLANGYQLFEDDNLNSADFILMGSGNHTKETAQSLANKIISVAEIRKDAVAFVSPHRGAFLSDGSAGSVTVFNDTQITDNVISFFAPVSSSSFAVFDSTYKYMYDRFADTFRYVPMNGDIAGLCARNDINNFVNIVEPFLRDVQAKRGIFDFRVICDETNNTAAIIDNNEFVADIFIKPARSINFVGLTFVATRTGVSFEEVVGSV